MMYSKNVYKSKSKKKVVGTYFKYEIKKVKTKKKVK